MNNIIRNCDNNCSDYQNQTFTVNLINNVSTEGIATYPNCKFGQQLTMPNISSTETRDFLGWTDNGIFYPAGTTINIQSNMNLQATFSQSEWTSVWTGSATFAYSSSLDNSAIVEGRKTRVTAQVTSYYGQLVYDGCDEYMINTSTTTRDMNVYDVPSTVDNCTFTVESGKLKVGFRYDYNTSDVGADGGRVVITKIEQCE